MFTNSVLGTNDAGVEIENNLDFAVTIVGASEFDLAGFEVSVNPSEAKVLTLKFPGKYDIYCDELPEAHLVVYVSESDLNWTGNSAGGAFFDKLLPGMYRVDVYAPRLPTWTAHVKVPAGTRETVKAELTVNDLPKAK
jgi:hypothetical protein